MAQFLLVYTGPPTPADATHEGWPEWFRSLGEALVDRGSPMTGGFAVRPGGSTSDDASPLNGYSMIEAGGREAVLRLLRDHPLLQPGSAYRIEVFELPARSG